MKSLEALDNLVHCKSITKCKECRHKNICTMERDYNTIKKDLERLNKLNKIFSDSHICEIKARFNEIECTTDKCDACPLSIGDDICLKIMFENKWKLQKENQELLVNKNVAQGIATKYKQVLDILKDKFYIKIHSNMFGSFLFIKEKTKNGEDVSCELDIEQAQKFKEVLGND